MQLTNTIAIALATASVASAFQFEARDMDELSTRNALAELEQRDIFEHAPRAVRPPSKVNWGKVGTQVAQHGPTWIDSIGGAMRPRDLEGIYARDARPPRAPAARPGNRVNWGGVGSQVAQNGPAWIDSVSGAMRPRDLDDIYTRDADADADARMLPHLPFLPRPPQLPHMPHGPHRPFTAPFHRQPRAAEPDADARLPPHFPFLPRPPQLPHTPHGPHRPFTAPFHRQPRGAEPEDSELFAREADLEDWELYARDPEAYADVDSEMY